MQGSTQLPVEQIAVDAVAARDEDRKLPHGWVKQYARDHHLPYHRLNRLLKKQEKEQRIGPRPKTTANEARNKTKFSVERSEEKVSIDSVSTDIRTVEDALARAEIDTDVWEVTRSKVNKWEVAAWNRQTQDFTVQELYQVTVWVERKKLDVDPEEFAQTLAKAVKQHSPSFPQCKVVKPVNNRKRVMYEIDIPDLHMGKLAWAPETNNNYDLDIAEVTFYSAVDSLLAAAPTTGLDKILFPVGNDLFHIDTPFNTTAHGTAQHVDGRWPKIFLRVYEMMTKTIDRMMGLAPEVEVVIVQGNHDYQTAWYLGVVLEAHYRNTAKVKVDYRPLGRKYISYGANLIGMTHGNEIKLNDLPAIMAVEAADMWEGKNFREWQLGHWHKEKETRFVATDTQAGGIGVRILSSLSAADLWHYTNGFIGNQRSAKGMTFAYDGGLVQQQIYYLDQQQVQARVDLKKRRGA